MKEYLFLSIVLGRLVKWSGKEPGGRDRTSDPLQEIAGSQTVLESDGQGGHNAKDDIDVKRLGCGFLRRKGRPGLNAWNSVRGLRDSGLLDPADLAPLESAARRESVLQSG